MLHDLFKHSTCFFPQLFFDIKPTTGAQPEIFPDRGGFVKLGHFNKHFVKNSRKKRLRRENFGVFSPRYS